MIHLALLHPVQIQDAIAQKAAILALQQSYDASKVITQIEKADSAGAYYTAEEILQLLNNKIENISSGGDSPDEFFTDAEIASIFNDN